MKKRFFKTSENLHNVEIILCGYSVQESGIYENDNLSETSTLGLNSCDAYVVVKNGKINIWRDFSNSFSELATNYSLKDIMNIEFYAKMAFHKELFSGIISVE